MKHLPSHDQSASNTDDPALTGEPCLTPDVIATAYRLHAMHHSVPNAPNTCLACEHSWPCPDHRWAQRQFARDGITPPSSPPLDPDSGG